MVFTPMPWRAREAVGPVFVSIRSCPASHLNKSEGVESAALFVHVEPIS